MSVGLVDGGGDVCVQKVVWYRAKRTWRARDKATLRNWRYPHEQRCYVKRSKGPLAGKWINLKINGFPPKISAGNALDDFLFFLL